MSNLITQQRPTPSTAPTLKLTEEQITLLLSTLKVTATDAEEASRETEDSEQERAECDLSESLLRLYADIQKQTDPERQEIALSLSSDDASDLMVALSEVIDRHGKSAEDAEMLEQVERWKGLSERIDMLGDWECA